MRQGERSPLGFYTIGIAALFLAGFFLLVVFGAKSYQNTVAGQYGNMDTRSLLSYLAASVKANDAKDAVQVEQSAFGPLLVIADGGSGYALRIYCRDGELLEDYAALDAPLAPDSAQVIGETAFFAAEKSEDGLLRLDTDAGSVLLQLRSERGAGA